MHTVETIAAVQEEVLRLRTAGRSIGFVPTMGAFHEGHLSLMRAARRECGAVVVSVFVNPTQFSPGEDFDRYPRDLAGDQELAAAEDVDILFIPSTKEMYPPGHATTVHVAGLTGRLCGKDRPGHFRGVTTVVAKLFNIVGPDTAYFGQKDAQQAVIIRRMVSDLDTRVKVSVLPIVRESDGLAMSSRNRYLNPEERQAAAVLYRALSEARAAVEAGEKDGKKVHRLVEECIAGEKLVRIEYVAVVDPDTLELLERIEGPALLAVAARVGAWRLIDNCIVGRDEL